MTRSRAIAVFFGVGLMRPAPGTWGSAVAVGLGLWLHRVGGLPLLALATLAAVGWGLWALERELADRPGTDPSEFVIDEVAGQWLALCFPAAGFWLTGLSGGVFPYPAWVAAFLFFRLLDIWKPGVIGRADRRDDPAGVMLDDLWAGLFAGIATLILAALVHGFLR